MSSAQDKQDNTATKIASMRSLEALKVKEETLQSRKYMNSAIVTALGLALATFETLAATQSENFTPLLDLIWVCSASSYVTTALWSYSSNLEGWVKWPILTVISLLFSFFPRFLIVLYSVEWPSRTAGEILEYYNVLYGPTLYLFINFFASKFDEELDREYEEEKEAIETEEKSQTLKESAVTEAASILRNSEVMIEQAKTAENSENKKEK